MRQGTSYCETGGWPQQRRVLCAVCGSTHRMRRRSLTSATSLQVRSDSVKRACASNRQAPSASRLVLRLVLRLVSHAIAVVRGARGFAGVVTPDRERERERERGWRLPLQHTHTHSPPHSRMHAETYRGGRQADTRELGVS
jgi:hypothetical protein